MFGIVDANNHEVAEAEDLASARVAVVCLLAEEEADELAIESPDGLHLESCKLDKEGNPVWKTSDIVRAFDPKRR